MSASLLRFAAHVDDRLAVGCHLCGAESPVPQDNDLHDCVWIVWDGDQGGLLVARDANGWRVVSHDSHGRPYCPSHHVLDCVRHAARCAGLHLPEVFR